MTSPGVLDCPEPENYAAVALQLQETALQAEQRIYLVERQLRAAANAFTFVQTTTAVRTGLGTGGFNLINPGSVANTITFTNWPNVLLGSDTPLVPGAGVYEVGFYGNLIASGVVTDNSVRQVRIKQTRDAPISGTEILVNTAMATIWEANVGGGMDVTVTGVFVCQSQDEIAFEMNHANVGSTMNVSSGAVYWMTYLGSPETVEVF